MTLINRLRAVLLVLVLLPLLTVATTPPAASAQSATRYLKLVSLKCIETEDWTGADEPFLEIYDGLGNLKSRVWSPSLNDGQTADLTSKPATKFEGLRLSVALFDDDAPDTEDWLGTHIIYASEAGQGYHTVSYTQDGANYQLTYYVY
jgi:lysozyme family protein